MVSRTASGLCTSSGLTVRNRLGGPKRRIIATSFAMHEPRSTAPHGTGRAAVASRGMILRSTFRPSFDLGLFAADMSKARKAGSLAMVRNSSLRGCRTTALTDLSTVWRCTWLASTNSSPASRWKRLEQCCMRCFVRWVGIVPSKASSPRMSGKRYQKASMSRLPLPTNSVQGRSSRGNLSASATAPTAASQIASPVAAQFIIPMRSSVIPSGALRCSALPSAHSSSNAASNESSWASANTSTDSSVNPSLAWTRTLPRSDPCCTSSSTERSLLVRACAASLSGTVRSASVTRCSVGTAGSCRWSVCASLTLVRTLR